jgi:hypothetical protein
LKIAVFETQKQVRVHRSSFAGAQNFFLLFSIDSMNCGAEKQFRAQQF